MTYFIASLIVYWILWLAWCLIMPYIVPVRDSDSLALKTFVAPKWWQFFMVMFLISYVFGKNNANH